MADMVGGFLFKSKYFSEEFYEEAAISSLTIIFLLIKNVISRFECRCPSRCPSRCLSSLYTTQNIFDAEELDKNVVIAKNETTTQHSAMQQNKF